MSKQDDLKRLDAARLARKPQKTAKKPARPQGRDSVRSRPVLMVGAKDAYSKVEIDEILRRHEARLEKQRNTMKKRRAAGLA